MLGIMWATYFLYAWKAPFYIITVTDVERYGLIRTFKKNQYNLQYYIHDLSSEN